MADLLINGAFSDQRVTGPQRYAVEVSARLVAEHGGRLVVPPRAVSGRAGLTHGWAHLALPLLSARGHLVSLTARSPVLARRHTLVVHDLFVLEHPEWFSEKYVRSHAPVLSAQLRTAARLVAVSEPVAGQLRRLHPEKPVQRLLEEPGVEGFLFAVGSRDPRKNFGRLTAAYTALPAAVRSAFPLIIAGGESDVFATSSVVPEAGVQWLGYVDDLELADLYATATAVAVPSLAEGFGLPVVEALTAGGRLAVSDIATLRWVAGTAARYFDPEDVDDIARVLLGMITDPPVQGDPAAVLSRFSWAATADEIARFALDGTR
jgi:hypothetical protein